MDVLYIYRRSSQEELELRYSLRSGEEQKLRRQIRYQRTKGNLQEEVDYRQAIVANAGRVLLRDVLNDQTTSRSFCRISGRCGFSAIGRDSCAVDDYVLLDFVREDDMRKDRALEDLSLSLRERAGVRAVESPPTSLWRKALLHTIDLLARLDLPLYNFESHVPAFLTKARVLEAYCIFRDFITEDRLYGPLALTAILNLAAKQDPANVVLLGEERSRAGFYRPADLATIEAHCADKKFLNFDEAGFNEHMLDFLDGTFSKPSAYEGIASISSQSTSQAAPRHIPSASPTLAKI